MKLYNFVTAFWTIAIFVPPTKSSSFDATDVLDTETFVTNENDTVDTSVQSANTGVLNKVGNDFLHVQQAHVKTTSS
jgi:hypothetical protein